MVLLHSMSETVSLLFFEHDDLKKRVSDVPVHLELETNVVDFAILRVPVGAVSSVEDMS